jgi:hypothetical protein
MELRKTPSGIEHGLITTLVNQVPKSKRFKNVEPKLKEELEAKVKRDSEVISVRYLNYKNQETGFLSKDYYAGAGEPIYMFKFLHDYVYMVPKGLVDQVNDPSRLSPKREGSLDANGQPLLKDGPPKRIHHFVRDI